MLFSHVGQDAGYCCLTAGCTKRRSGLMVMLNGDTYVPFLMKMLANPTGPPLTPQTIWPEFAKRSFAVWTTPRSAVDASFGLVGAEYREGS